MAVCHGYRQTWGIQTIKEMLGAGEIGNWISIEGRYWQSSAAQKKLSGDLSKTWKDDVQLSGEFDVVLDLSTHFTDLIFFLAGEKPKSGTVRRLYQNASASHRDTHNIIQMEFQGNRQALGSISKTAHGSGNDLEIHVIGEKRSVSWAFMNPDELTIGEGQKRYTISRPDRATFGSQQYAFHGLGWLEGYVEIFKQFFLQMRKESYQPYPNLFDQKAVLSFLFNN